MKKLLIFCVVLCHLLDNDWIGPFLLHPTLDTVYVLPFSIYKREPYIISAQLQIIEIGERGFCKYKVENI